MRIVFLVVFACFLLAGCQPAGRRMPMPVTETAPPTRLTPASSASPGAGTLPGSPIQMGSEVGCCTPMPAASPTSQPTATPVLPTSTPVATPTPDPNQGVGDVVYQDEFDGGSGWGWTFQAEGLSFGLAQEQLLGRVTKAGLGWMVTLGPAALKVGNHQIRVRAYPLTCTGHDEYGLWLRGQLRDDAHFDGYLIKFNCAGQFRVELLRASEPNVLIDWVMVPVINTTSAEANSLLIWMAGGEFRFYANDQYLNAIQDSTFAEGNFGFYLWRRGEAETAIAFDELSVRTVNLP